MSDQNIWYLSFDGTAWSPAAQIPNSQTAATPALATFNNTLYSVHRGGNDTNLWYAAFDGTKWTPDTPIANYQSAAGPALTTVNGKLYSSYRGI
jgi:hypothetical protein